MYDRHLIIFLKQVIDKYPVLTIVGPRQSGKSTLCRMAFPNYTYVSMEDPDRRMMAINDARGFFKTFKCPLIIDEIQRVPDLLSYIQTLVDEPNSKHKFILTGSHQLLLMEKITQSLAGRTVITTLLPFSYREIIKKPGSILLEKSNQDRQTDLKNTLQHSHDIDDLLFTGGYPRIFDKQLNPRQWLEQYYMSYVERDVRSLTQITEIDLFHRFIRLCAGRVGQLLNLSSLANDCGISQPTARAWISILRASFICFTLQPHFKNFSKRLIKTPKLYFFDTGLLCYLLKSQNKEALIEHPLRGNIFENWVITEWMKSYYNKGIEPPFYFWRDAKGHEIDLIIDLGTQLYPIEIKSSYTFHQDFIKHLRYFYQLQSNGKKDIKLGECIYAGNETFSFHDFRIRSYLDL